jgi:hypothetical protein
MAPMRSANRLAARTAFAVILVLRIEAGLVAVAGVDIVVGSAVATMRRTELDRLALLPAARPPVHLIVVIALDDAVEPFADRGAGLPCGLACSVARLRTVTSKIPRTARFHSRAQDRGGSLGRSRAGARKRTIWAARSLCSPLSGDC